MKSINNDILKEYVCNVPFNYLEIHADKVWSCCPSWLSTPIGDTDKLSEIWNGETLKQIQNSILDGSYSYCDKKLCPHLNELIHNGNVTNVFEKKSKTNNKVYTKKGPLRINLAFDRSCNLSCPSCRISLIMANGKKLDIIDKTMNDVIDVFGNDVNSLYISGTADPFASKTFRNFLLNFDETKFSNLDTIHIHTNALLLDEDIWNKLTKVKKFIKTIDVSIDAAKKETYSIVRRGGDWDALQNNIKFIASISSIHKKRFSFVVQDNNYQEMFDYYKLIKNLPHNTGYEILFTKILNWGTFSESEYKLKQIWNEEHPEFKLFLEELQKIVNQRNVITNMNDIIDKYLSKKTNIIDRMI